MERKVIHSVLSPDASDLLSAFAPVLPGAGIGKIWLDGLADLQRQTTDFVFTRIEEDVKTQQALLHCKSLTEMQGVQAGYLQTAFEQYQAELGRIVAKSGDIAARMKSGAAPQVMP